MESKFKDLVNQLSQLVEDQEGKLRGGFGSASQTSMLDDELASNDYCNNNKCVGGSNYQCTNAGCS